VTHGKDGRLGAVVKVQFIQNIAQVVFNCIFGDMELFTN